jgi:hypothetical protein
VAALLKIWGHASPLRLVIITRTFQFVTKRDGHAILRMNSKEILLVKQAGHLQVPGWFAWDRFSLITDSTRGGYFGFVVTNFASRRSSETFGRQDMVACEPLPVCYVSPRI